MSVLISLTTIFGFVSLRYAFAFPISLMRGSNWKPSRPSEFTGSGTNNFAGNLPNYIVLSSLTAIII